MVRYPTTNMKLYLSQKQNTRFIVFLHRAHYKSSLETHAIKYILNDYTFAHQVYLSEFLQSQKTGNSKRDFKKFEKPHQQIMQAQHSCESSVRPLTAAAFTLQVNRLQGTFLATERRTPRYLLASANQ